MKFSHPPQLRPKFQPMALCAFSVLFFNALSSAADSPTPNPPPPLFVSTSLTLRPNDDESVDSPTASPPTRHQLHLARNLTGTSPSRRSPVKLPRSDAPATESPPLPASASPPLDQSLPSPIPTENPPAPRPKPLPLNNPDTPPPTPVLGDLHEPADAVELPPLNPADNPFTPEEGTQIRQTDWSQSLTDQAANDPAARAARYRAITNADSLLDGLGGIPSPIGSPFESLEISGSRKRFRIGPISILGPAIQIGASVGSFSSLPPPTVNGAPSPSANDSSSGVNGFQSNAALSFGLHLGQPALGHTLDLQYSGSYQYPPNGTQSQATGNNDQSPFNQQISLLGSWNFVKLQLGLSIAYSGLSGLNRDFGGNVNRQLLNIALTSNYAFTPKTSASWDVFFPISQISTGIDSTDYNSSFSINHLLSPKLSLGIGFAVGINQNSNSANLQSFSPTSTLQPGNRQTSEQIFAQIAFHPSPRVSLSGQAGLQILQAGDTHKTAPNFNLTAAWILREGTTLSLTGTEQIQSSGSTANENFITTTLVLGASQRLGNRMNLSLSLGYELATYYAITTTAATDRIDHLYSAQASWSLQLSPQWSATLLYAYSNNHSTTNGFTSSRGQLQMTFVF